MPHFGRIYRYGCGVLFFAIMAQLTDRLRTSLGGEVRVKHNKARTISKS